MSQNNLLAPVSIDFFMDQMATCERYESQQIGTTVLYRFEFTRKVVYVLYDGVTGDYFQQKYV